MRGPVTLVLIPGLMCDQAVWSQQVGALQPLAASIRVPDHALHASLADMAQAILDDIPGPLALAGHSMGGRVAFEVARRAPQRIRGVALLDTGYRPLAPGDEGAREVDGRMRLLEQARRDGMRAMAHTWLQNMVHPRRLADQRLLQTILDMCARRTVEQFAAQIQALIRRPSAQDVLASLRGPTLLLCGEQDQWSPPAAHRAMQAMAAGSRFIGVPDCGHMSPMEQPEAVAAALRDWFEQCLAPS